MGLPIRHQWSLRRIESSLRRSDPQFVTMMSAFAAVALEGKMPQHERLRPRRRWQGRLVAGTAAWLMLVCMTAAAIAWTAIRGLATEVAAVLRTGRDVRHAAAAGARGVTGARHHSLS
jgi:Protein of unknown function (DUF3040)